ncbi:MAG: repressor LexA [Nitrospirota bacterium]|nr:repressor LexA [Nitrospirota bacterium]
MKLTPRQSEVLALIRARVRSRGLPPTRREIADALGLASANAAESHLKALAAKGAIRLLPGAARGIRLTGHTTAAAPVSDAGHASAPPVVEWEQPMPALPPHTGLGALFTPTASHLLRVAAPDPRDVAPGGDALHPGDLLVISPRPPGEGDLVTARVDGRRVVRHFEQHGHWVLLLGRGEPHPLRADLRRGGVLVDGVVEGLIRTTLPPGPRATG